MATEEVGLANKVRQDVGWLFPWESMKIATLSLQPTLTSEINHSNHSNSP